PGAVRSYNSARLGRPASAPVLERATPLSRATPLRTREMLISLQRTYAWVVRGSNEPELASASPGHRGLPVPCCGRCLEAGHRVQLALVPRSDPGSVNLDDLRLLPAGHRV